MEIILQNLDLFIFLALMVLGYTAGSIAEKRHYKSIHRREKELVKLAVVTEVVSPHDVDLVASYADILQVGARNIDHQFIAARTECLVARDGD